jgi:hypothetical protein
MKIILIILINIIEISSYILPQTFREWTIIGIDKHINNQMPYHYNIGNLPMVLWYNKTNPQTIINSCNKHLGNTLKDSYIIDNELICPFHKKSYTNDDNIGEIQKRNGLIWWSYKSFKKHPPKFLNEDNNNYHLNVRGDFISIILNLIGDFNGNEETCKIHKKKLLIKKEREFIIYKYPYTLIYNNLYMINVIPIDESNSHFYLTTLKKLPLNYNDLNKFKTYIENRCNEFRFKYLLLGEGNSYINKVYKLYNEYMYPNDITIKYFLTNKRYY